MVAEHHYHIGGWNPYGEVLEELEEIGTVRVGSHFQVRAEALQPGNAWSDLTAADRSGGPIVLRYGRDILDSSRKHTVRDGITALLVAGKDRAYKEKTNITAQNRRGRRIEGYETASNIEDVNSLAAYAQAKVESLSRPARWRSPTPCW